MFSTPRKNAAFEITLTAVKRKKYFNFDSNVMMQICIFFFNLLCIGIVLMV